MLALVSEIQRFDRREHLVQIIVIFWRITRASVPTDRHGKGKGPLHGPLTRYAKLRVAHAPGMPGTFSPPPLVSDSDMHHGTCLTHVPWCMPGSLTSGFLWNRWRGKRSRHFRRMRNPQFWVSGKRPMAQKYDDVLTMKRFPQYCFIGPWRGIHQSSVVDPHKAQ